MRDALERETSGSILDPSKSIDRNRTHHRQHDGDQHCAPQNSLSNPNPGLRQRNDFRAEDKVNSSAQAKNNGVHDKPVLVSAGWLDLFVALFTRGSLQLFANFGALADFLHRVGHHDWNRNGNSNRPDIPRHFGSSKATEPAAQKRISGVLSNTDVAELLSQQAERETGILSRAFRRAARSAFLWPEEVADLVAQNRSPTELRSVGPFIEKQIRNWIDKPPRRAKTVPAIRQDFISLAEARRLLAARPGWRSKIRGDLQMHTRWSDGSGTVAEMADVAKERSYEYIGITDHSKGLKIAGGIDERALKRQGTEIAKVNAPLSKSASQLIVLRSIEMNLNPRGEGDMSPESLVDLDLVLGSFHSSLRTTEDQTERYLAALRNPHVHIIGHPRGRIYNFRLGLNADWPHVFAEAA